ncbi:MAG: aquaporin [Planctomycetes bacterium]|nr:aquaporin [Planctomycetota bacterium]
MTAPDAGANLRRWAAEFIGTFALVFIGAGACIAHHGHPDDITHVGVALAFGGVVACMVYCLGHVSGAHINPAVTVALAAVRGFPMRDVAPYIAAQCAGAFLASAAHLVTFGSAAASAAHFGSTFPVGTTLAGAFAFEFVLTFILMLVIMAVATDARVPPGAGGLAIGAAVCVDCLAAGKCCGASMNPARSLAPAVLAGGPALSALWLYLCAPALGAVVAALTYRWMRGTKPDRQRQESWTAR